MKRGMLLVSLMLAACAGAPKHVAHPDEKDDSADLQGARSEPAAKVRLVVLEPQASRYHYLGKVTGVSQVGEWVQTAKNAQADLQSKARSLGADVVKIDQVRVPADDYRGQFVLLTGRAYREKKIVRRSRDDED